MSDSMSRSDLISILSEETGAPCNTKKSIEVYRDKVGLIMVDRLLEKLNSDTCRNSTVTLCWLK